MPFHGNKSCHIAKCCYGSGFHYHLFGGFVSNVFCLHPSNGLAKDATLFSHSWLHFGDLLAWPHVNSFLRSRVRGESWGISGVMEQVRARLHENTYLPAIRSHRWHLKFSNFMSLGNISLRLIFYSWPGKRVMRPLWAFVWRLKCVVEGTNAKISRKDCANIVF